jgi:hypothetical protein
MYTYIQGGAARENINLRLDKEEEFQKWMGALQSASTHRKISAANSMAIDRDTGSGGYGALITIHDDIRKSVDFSSMGPDSLIAGSSIGAGKGERRLSKAVTLIQNSQTPKMEDKKSLVKEEEGPGLDEDDFHHFKMKRADSLLKRATNYQDSHIDHSAAESNCRDLAILIQTSNGKTRQKAAKALAQITVSLFSYGLINEQKVIDAIVQCLWLDDVKEEEEEEKVLAKGKIKASMREEEEEGDENKLAMSAPEVYIYIYIYE